MSGTKIIVGAALAPLAIPILALAQAGPSGIAIAIETLTVKDSLTFLSFPAGAALTIFVLGRRVQRFVDDVKRRDDKHDERLVEISRKVDVHHAKTRGRFSLLFSRVEPPVGFLEVQEAEHRELEELESDA